MTTWYDSCSECGIDLPPDIDTFSDGRGPCPACGSSKRTLSGEAFLSRTGTVFLHPHDVVRPVGARPKDRRPAAAVIDEVRPSEPATARPVAKETRFTLRVVHPTDAGESWMAVAAGPLDEVLAIGCGDDPDEALLSVIDDVAGYTFEA